MNVTTLELTIDASGAVRGAAQYEKATKQAAGGAKRATSASTDLGGALQGVRTAFGAVVAGAAVRSILEYADTATLLEARLRLVTDSQAELESVTASLRDIADDNRQSFEATATLYARVARGAKEYGATSEDVLAVTEAVNAAILVSGASATEAEASIIQLSQGLASGALRGEELRSVLEQTPRVAQAIAEGLGVTVGQLRELGSEGELTTERIIEALRGQLPALREEASDIPLTFGQSLTVLRNAGLELAGALESTTGAVAGLAAGVQGLAGFLRENAGAVGVLSAALGAAGLVKATTSAIAALRGLAAAQTLAAILSLAGGVKTLSDALVLARIASAAAWRALLGPIGLIITGVAAVAAVVNKLTKDRREAAEAEREYAAALRDNSRAELDREVAALEGRRVELVAALEELANAPNGFRERALRKELEQVTSRLDTAVDALRETRDAFDDVGNAGAAALSKLEIEVSNVEGALAAFRSGGDRAREAFEKAAREWDVAANSGRTLAQALEANDPAALAAVDGALALVDATGRLKRAQEAAKEAADRLRDAKEAAANEARALRDAEEALAASLQRLAEKQAAGRLTLAEQAAERERAIDLAIREQTATLAGADALAAFQVELAGEEAVRRARNTAREANIILSNAELENIRSEAELLERLKQALDRAKQSAQGLGEQPRAALSDVGALAQGFADVSFAIGGALEALGAFGESLASNLQLVGQLATGFNRIQRAGITGEGEDQRNVGFTGALRGQAGAAGVAAALGGVGAVVGVVSQVADAFDLFGSRAKEREQELRRLAAEFNAALEEFGRFGEVESALERGLRELEAQAVELGRKAAEAIGVEGFTPQGIEDVRKVRDILAGIVARYNTNLGDLKALNDVLFEYEENIRKLRESLEAEVAQRREDLEVRRLVAAGETAAAEALRDSLAAQREYNAALEEFGDIAPEYLAELARVQAAELEAARLARERAAAEEERAAKARAADTELELAERRALLAGDEELAQRLALTRQAEQELEQRRKQFASGEISLDQLRAFEQVIGRELTAALTELAVSASQAADEERRLANERRTEELAAKQAELNDLERERLEVLARGNSFLARSAEEQLRALSRQDRLNAALSDAARSRLEEIFRLEDQVDAQNALNAAREREIEAQRRLRDLTSSLEVQLLRETGRELDAALLELRNDIAAQREAIIEAGGGEEELRLLSEVFAARRRNLLEDARPDPVRSPSERSVDDAFSSTTRVSAPTVTATAGDTARLLALQSDAVTVLRSIDARLASLGGVSGGTSRVLSGSRGAASSDPFERAVDRALGTAAANTARRAGTPYAVNFAGL